METALRLRSSFVFAFSPCHQARGFLLQGKPSKLLAILHGSVAIFVLVVIWQVIIWAFEPRGFLLPSPGEVVAVYAEQGSYLARHALTTIGEMVLGLVIGSATGIVVALVLSHFPILDRYLMPLVVATQTLPVFAIAPLLVIWFGFGIGSKIVMASLIIFFPVASAFYDGLKQTSRGWLDLGHNWGASRVQLLWFMRIPAAMPSLVSGLKVAATLAPIGAIVGEWAGAAGGLGFVMLQANARTQSDVVFAALIILAVSAWLLRAATILLAERCLWWARHTHG
jgi:putative hydroxymethylpyrimidine transport system permease protein